MPDDFHVHLYGDHGPIESTFEDAVQRLEQLPKLYFEPDGSFVWNRDGGRQRVFGMLYDAADRLQYVELRGVCERETWRVLIAAIAGEGRVSTVSVLPEGSMQDLQSFEKMTWKEGQE